MPSTGCWNAKIPFDRVNDHDPENIAKYGEGGKKIYAHCYIDDKNIGGFPGWLACVEEIERMEEAYKTILKEDKTKYEQEEEIIRTIRNFKRILKSGNVKTILVVSDLGYIYKNIHY
mgnify:CR=1 FL=1